MSYKAAVLYDYPIAYYPLDDLTTVDLVDTFTAFLAQFDTYQDVLDNISSYANIYGDIAYDHSGCENDGNYIGDPAPDLIPLVAGNSRATNIRNNNSIVYTIKNDYTATATTSQFGTAPSSDNDFTIEFWFYPSFTTTTETPLVADTISDIGVFYEKGNITFKVNTESITYTLPYIKKSFYVICKYNQESISLYIDGILVASKELTNFIFSNSSVAFQSGPTSSASDYFLINSVAFYRYTLSDQAINYHMQEALTLPPINVSEPDGGELFEIYDNDASTVHRYLYPVDRSWFEIVTDGVDYNISGNYLQMTPTTTQTSSTVTIDDFISIASAATMDSSKIEWYGDNGISVLVSTDGITYVACTNGNQIPGYDLNSFGTLNGLYVRIVFTSSDTSKYLPRLYKLAFSFYNNQTLYSENGSSFISTLENDAAVSNYNITFGTQTKDILTRDYCNGLKTIVDSGFQITTTKGINTVEFFYTPYALTASGLISTVAANGYAASNISWNGLGAISKTNISALYVNGINKTSATNISNIFRDDQMHHVVVVFSSAVSNEIRFNYSLAGSIPALYQYIAIYESQFTNTLAAGHYDLYIRRSTVSQTDSSTPLVTEDGAEFYNNDWLVIQSV